MSENESIEQGYSEEKGHSAHFQEELCPNEPIDNFEPQGAEVLKMELSALLLMEKSLSCVVVDRWFFQDEYDFKRLRHTE